MDKKISLFDDDYDQNESAADFDTRIEDELLRSNLELYKSMVLNSNYVSDYRFLLDESFFDFDYKEKKDEVENDKVGKSEFTDEKSKNISILEEVLGKPLKKAEKLDKKENKICTTLTLPRYDPTKEESKAYEIGNREVDIMHKKIRVDFDKVEEKLQQGKKTKLQRDKLVDKKSKTTFYEVSPGLKDAFAKEGEFKFTSFFGITHDEQAATISREKQLKLANEQSTSTQLKSDKYRNPFEKNPFKYDSSDSEDDQKEIEKTPDRKNQKIKSHKFTSTFKGFSLEAEVNRLDSNPFYSKELIKKINDTSAERKLNMARAFAYRKRAAIKNLKAEKKNAAKKRLKIRMLKMRRNKNWKCSTSNRRPRVQAKVGVTNMAKF